MSGSIFSFVYTLLYNFNKILYVISDEVLRRWLFSESRHRKMKIRTGRNGKIGGNCHSGQYWQYFLPLWQNSGSARKHCPNFEKTARMAKKCHCGKQMAKAKKQHFGLFSHKIRGFLNSVVKFDEKLDCATDQLVQATFFEFGQNFDWKSPWEPHDMLLAQFWRRIRIPRFSAKSKISRNFFENNEHIFCISRHFQLYQNFVENTVSYVKFQEKHYGAIVTFLWATY